MVKHPENGSRVELNEISYALDSQTHKASAMSQVGEISHSNNNEAKGKQQAITSDSGSDRAGKIEVDLERENHSEFGACARGPLPNFSRPQNKVTKVPQSVRDFYTPKRLLQKAVKNLHSLEYQSTKAFRKKKATEENKYQIHLVAAALNNLTFEGIQTWIEVIDLLPEAASPDSAPLPVENSAKLAFELTDPSESEPSPESQGCENRLILSEDSYPKPKRRKLDLVFQSYA